MAMCLLMGGIVRRNPHIRHTPNPKSNVSVASEEDVFESNDETRVLSFLLHNGLHPQ